MSYLDKNSHNFIIINTPKLNNKIFIPINLIVLIFLIFKSLLFLRKKKKIEKVFSTGGYMSLPLMIAAKLLKLDIYLLEPNHILGRANKFFRILYKNFLLCRKN